jgi:hypothetical protein
MLRSEKVSACGTTSRRCVPGTTRMQPLSTVLGLSATQAVTTSPSASSPSM